MQLPAIAWALAGLLGLSGAAMAQEQVGDRDWRPRVEQPAFAADGPIILVDQGHGSEQRLEGRFRAFAYLAKVDGFRIEASRTPFDAADALASVSVLVIANPARPEGSPEGTSAFSPAEIGAIAEWVANGGALLLAADHSPHGAAAEALAARFGVKMGRGYAFQIAGQAVSANLIYPRPAMADHPIIDGRTPAESVNLVQTFTGQSLQGPPGSTSLLAMSADAWEAPDLAALQAIRAALGQGEPADSVLHRLARRALPDQAVAVSFGRGRVVVLGETAMVTAQRVESTDGAPPLRFGMNENENDNARFVLNTLHWLCGLLD